ncbi:MULTISPECIES: hypothetical protein [unclassified Nocardioides]|uniref:hypothetical protein n=1 Tax=unclassified Nocardioides TaxID=2615069 RepID=UPI0006F7850A|nr:MULTISPECIES: hypothetical protein [unclassified Nocardioides]KRA31431.1 hypothetical protein ASD81_18530 [Nocardioides sp. Root614]KRA88051.1 hypothetical protein ASD84_18805 [Nocardioides sp. Root682]
MTDETRLRSLLQAAVPDDASTLDPQTVSTAARSARHRSRLIGLGAAAATVAVIGTVAVVSTQGPDRGRAADDSGTTAPYDAPACPATLPELNDANQTTGNLDGLTSVRLCPDLGRAMASPMSAADQRSVLAGMDALVEDLEGLRAALAASPEPDPGRCATISVLNSRQSLLFTMGNHSTIVPTILCGTIQVEGNAVDGGDLARAFLSALDRQRDELDYHRDYTGPLGCDQVDTSSPARPGREHLVAAVICPPRTDDGSAREATRLDDDQLAALEAAWQNPGDVAEDLNDFGENTCTELEDPSSTLLAATDHGDVVRLTESPCGFLYWSSWELGEGKALPTTLKDLGLD